MIAACASRYTGAAEPLIVGTRHGQLILYMMDGTGSWGSGVEAASWFRDWLADTHMDDLRASPTTVSETLRAGIRQLPPAIRDDDYHWSFSIVAVIADDDTIQLGACGGFAAAAVSGTHIAHLLTPARLIDKLVAEGHVPESEAEGHKYAHVLCGPFFGVDDHDKLTWLPPVAKAAQSLILIGESGLHRYLAAQRDHNLHIDPVALRDAVEAFSGRSAPTAVIDGV